MLFSIVFTYPKSENQNLFLVCNEGIQCTPKYFVIPFSPLAIVFDLVSCFRCSFTSFRIRTIWNTALESKWKDKSNDVKTFKNRTPTAREILKYV